MGCQGQLLRGSGTRALKEKCVLQACLIIYQLTCSTLAGKPEVGFDVDNIRPGWLLLIPAAVLLLSGKPLSGTRSFGNLHARVPLLSDDAIVKVSASCTHFLLRRLSSGAAKKSVPY